MLLMRKNGSTSNVFRFTLRNSSTGDGLSGLDHTSTGLIISTICDNEATPTTYTVAGSTVETISALGTFSAPTATKCRFKQVDATNHKGLYELQLADARFAVSGAKIIKVTISGATNLLLKEITIQLTAVDLDDSVRMGQTALPNAAAAAAGGLLTYGTGTGQLNPSGGKVAATVGPRAVNIGYLGEITSSGSLTFKFPTLDAANAPATLGGSPAVAVYESSSPTEDTTAVAISADFDSVVGMNQVTIAPSLAAAFYTVGSFDVVLTSGTVGGVSVAGTVIASFSISSRVVQSVSTVTGNVNGNVGGNVAGSVGSVVAGVTLADDAITAAKIATDAITAAKIAANAITSAKIADDAITAGKIASNALTAAKVATDLLAAIANKVESEIIDDTDSEKVLEAITNKIAAVNPSLAGLTLSAIALQVRTELTTELDRIDVMMSSRLAGDSYVAPDNATIASTASAVSALPNASSIATAVWQNGTRTLSSFGTLVADIATAVWTTGASVLTMATRFATMIVQDGSVWQFTVNSLENAPAGEGGTGGNVTVEGFTPEALAVLTGLQLSYSTPVWDGNRWTQPVIAGNDFVTQVDVTGWSGRDPSDVDRVVLRGTRRGESFEWELALDSVTESSFSLLFDQSPTDTSLTAGDWSFNVYFEWLSDDTVIHRETVFPPDATLCVIRLASDS